MTTIAPNSCLILNDSNPKYALEYCHLVATMLSLAKTSCHRTATAHSPLLAARPASPTRPPSRLHSTVILHTPRRAPTLACNEMGQTGRRKTTPLPFPSTVFHLCLSLLVMSHRQALMALRLERRASAHKSVVRLPLPPPPHFDPTSPLPPSPHPQVPPTSP